MKAIDLGAGHASGGETLTQRIMITLKSSGYLNESIGAGYLERNWPPALKDTAHGPFQAYGRRS